MIQSILDNDLYKFTMQQAVHSLYPRACAKYEFTNRGGTPFPPGFAQKVSREIEKMATLSLSRAQKTYLKNRCSFFTPDYLDYLESYIYNPCEVVLEQEKSLFSLKIEGPWHRTILWEVPLMAIISETFFSMTRPVTLSRKQIRARNLKKAAVMAENHLEFADFGTRRRFSYAVHDMLITDILQQKNHTLIGTSNVHLARKFNLSPVGTLAHEWIMFHGATAGLKKALTIHNECKGKIKDAYGIGTHLTNDVGVPPLNMVIKLSQCRLNEEQPWRHAIKLSDDRGKHTGNPKALEACMAVLNMSPC
jgi:nicotinate phosphoribosyltransferase